jgi:phenylacetate-CoA ligase
MDTLGRWVGGVVFPGVEAARGRPTLALGRLLARTQWASRDELEARQGGLLRRLVRHAYRHTAWYRQALDARGLTPDDIRSPGDLALLPLLERVDAQASVVARSSLAPPRAVVHKATTGSTGRPMPVAYNAESRHWRDATRWRGYGWAGYRVGHKALHYWAAAAEPPTTWQGRARQRLDRWLKRDHYLDCTGRGDARLDELVGWIRRERPDVIVAYAQSAADLARRVNATGARDWGRIPVLCCAEPVLPHDRAALVAAFGAAFETYGSREVMLMAAECEAHAGLHVSMETMVVELVVRNPDGTTRPAAPGEAGEVVVTDLHNLAQPLLRYVNGDLARAAAPGPCACGRALDRLDGIEGRRNDTLRDGRGAPVSGMAVVVLFVTLAETCAQFQAHQRADGALTLRVVPTGGRLAPSTRARVERYCAERLPGVPVTVEEVADIPPGPGGKRRLVIVEPPAAGGAAGAGAL